MAGGGGGRLDALVPRVVTEQVNPFEGWPDEELQALDEWARTAACEERSAMNVATVGFGSPGLRANPTPASASHRPFFQDF
jgi:hypothetical protein